LRVLIHLELFILLNIINQEVITICGIFGSKDFTTYVKLYKGNKERGTFSYGGLLVGSHVHAVLKSPGVVTLTNKLVIEYDKKKKSITDFNIFLGHTQAPTSLQRKFSPSTSHPFQYKNWIVAHNGVLTNDKELKKRLDKRSYNVVDSSVIAPLINKCFKKTTDEVKAICEALSQLQGTFGLWIYNQESTNIYLARSGSTLYADFITNDFSSIKEKEYISLEEGVLFLITKEGLTSVGQFKPNSPFFTL
jgi:glucosamine 6-phosphate synthetase-like amidotransferase/phosphosugar isomerase protein